jgi:methionyl-tRNA formyltransferase
MDSSCPKLFLTLPRFGCLNIHASLLPRWRGASPIQRAIESGDAQSGVTIMQMDEGLDTGAMLLKRAVNLHATTTASSLHDELSALGSVMIEEVLEGLHEGRVFHPEPQESLLATYAALLKKEDGKINWSRSAYEIDRQVRAFNPWPGTFTLNAQGKRLRILEGEPLPLPLPEGQRGSLLSKNGEILCGEGSVYRIRTLQPENGKPMDPKGAISGHYFTVGEI